MKSRINRKDKFIILSFSLKTWVYILRLLRMELDKKHTPFFKRLFSVELSEIKEITDFNPPFCFAYDATASLKVKDKD